MKASFNPIIRVPWAVIILILLIIGIVILAICLYYLEDTKYMGLLGGILGGLIVYVANIFMDLFALKELEKYQRMGVQNLLRNRHEKNYYKPIIRDASVTVKVIGASCSRFVTDFLDMDSDDKVLVDSLRAHPTLTVKLLIPDERHISERSKSQLGLIQDKITKLEGEFKNQFGIRRFPHKARHSLVIADDHLITGPIFESVESMHAPAVHVHVATPFGEKYVEYFETLWKQCDPGPSNENRD